MKNAKLIGLLVLLVAFGAPFVIHSQSQSPVPATPVQAVPAYYPTIPISATAAVNNVTTLTLPAPPAGQYNYVCTLALNVSASNTGAAVISNSTGSSTNFNSWANKISFVGTANTDYDWSVVWGEPATGCAKSSLPGTATTFVSPTPGAQNAMTWYATYYQAP
jgi:hypothetical protein